MTRKVYTPLWVHNVLWLEFCYVLLKPPFLTTHIVLCSRIKSAIRYTKVDMLKIRYLQEMNKRVKLDESFQLEKKYTQRSKEKLKKKPPIIIAISRRYANPKLVSVQKLCHMTRYVSTSFPQFHYGIRFHLIAEWDPGSYPNFGTNSNDLSLAGVSTHPSKFNQRLKSSQ